MGISEFPRGYFLFSTWGRIISSEVSFDSSEVSFLAYVENFHFLRGDWRISTWGLANFHVAIFYSSRGDESFPPKFHLIPPKFCLSPTWRIFIPHVEIGEYPRGDWRNRGRVGCFCCAELFVYLWVEGFCH